MSARTGRTTSVLVLVLLSCQVGVAQQQGDSAADLASIERRVQAAYEKIAPAVVRITYGTHLGRESTLCSGVIVTAEGHVVTTSSGSNRVLRDELLEFHLADGRRVRGKALGWSSEWRIGLLQMTEDGPWPHVELGSGADVKAGQLCIALGYPDLTDVEFDRWPAVCPGSIMKSASPIWLTSSCQLKMHGHSIFDLEGRLVGVTCKFNNSREDHLHTSVEMIRAHWDDLVAGKNLDRVRLLSSETETGDSPAAPGLKSPPAGDEERIAAAIEKATAASVRVVRAAGDEEGWSGTIVTADGYVITCGHHEELPGRSVTLHLSDGREASAVILGTNPVSDVGLIKITGKGPWPYVPLGHSAIMQPGDRCVFMGYPNSRLGRQLSVSEARIIVRATGVRPPKDEWECEFWTLGVEPKLKETGVGISGGGAFDREGRVVGVILGGTWSAEMNERRHARIELFRRQWDLLAAGKPVDVVDVDPLAEITGALRRIAEDLPPIVVEVLVDGKPRVLGTIVGSDGQILTKASELEGEVSCRLADGRAFPASVQKVSQEHDLALLKIDAAGLPEARWSQEESVAPGTLIAAIVPGQPAQTGVVSLAARPRPRAAGSLGVIIDESGDRLKVHDAGASHGYEVPFRKGDVLVHVEDRPIPDFDSYLAVFQPKSGTAIAYAGDTVRVGVERDGEALELRFALPPSNYWAYSAKDASRRWWGFSSVFDIDIRLTPEQCGGPVIDRSGCVVGIVIACLGKRFSGRHVIPAHVARGACGALGEDSSSK